MSISRQLDLPVPAGFVITTRAYRRFVEHNQVDSHIHSLFDAYLSNKIDVFQASRQIQYALLAGVMPQEIVRETRRLPGGASHFGRCAAAPMVRMASFLLPVCTKVFFRFQPPGCSKR